jgi:uncharacterized protein
VRAGTTLSIADARRLAIHAQMLGVPRPKGPVTARHLKALMNTIGTIQLDAINVLERTQFIVPFSRLGAYDNTRLQQMTGPGGEWFEYWGHAASLMPVEHQPLFRWRMDAHGPYGESPTYTARREAFRKEHADYLEAVLAEVRERGPIPSSQLSDPRRRDGEWWDRRSMGRVALEALFADGLVAAWRAPNFERVYDLPERVIPADILAQSTPNLAEAQRELLLLAARALGVATIKDLTTYYITTTKIARPLVGDLVAEGELVEVRVDGWRDAAYTLPNAKPKPVTREHATVLSPFDSLIWDRPRTLRLFGFEYTIEVYVPAPKRKYGYYVLPVLLGEELVGRLDLKSDRKADKLLVRGAYREPQADAQQVAAALAPELDLLRHWLGLERVEIGRKGNLAASLRATR